MPQKVETTTPPIAINDAKNKNETKTKGECTSQRPSCSPYLAMAFHVNDAESSLSMSRSTSSLTSSLARSTSSLINSISRSSSSLSNNLPRSKTTLTSSQTRNKTASSRRQSRISISDSEISSSKTTRPKSRSRAPSAFTKSKNELGDTPSSSTSYKPPSQPAQTWRQRQRYKLGRRKPVSTIRGTLEQENLNLNETLTAAMFSFADAQIDTILKGKEKEKEKETQKETEKGQAAAGKKGKGKNVKGKAEKVVKPKPLTEKQVDMMFELAEMFTKVKQNLISQTETLDEHEEVITQVEQAVDGLERIAGTSQLVWRIDNFSEKFKEAANGTKPIVYSPSFKSHQNGYLMALSLCPNGDGKARGKHMSIFFCILHGDYDSLLMWPFSHEITFSLLDQSGHQPREDIHLVFTPSPNHNNLTFLGKPKSVRNPSLGLPRFVSHELLWNGDFVKDDIIYIRIQINLREASVV